MGLRQQAERDARAFLNDKAAGFGWEISVTNPAGTEAVLVGYSDDISQAIDPETGLFVTGRTVSVALGIADLTASGVGIPEAIPNAASRPFVVEFDDLEGNPQKFKVARSVPDRGIGVVLLYLEVYET